MSKTPKGRPDDEALLEWTKKLFPDDEMPESSEQATTYTEAVIRDKIQRYSPTINGWQFVVEKLAERVYDYITKKEEIETLKQDLIKVIKEKRDIVNAMNAELSEVAKKELDDTISAPAKDADEAEWDRHINELLKAAAANHKSVIKTGILRNQEKSKQIRTIISMTEKAGYNTDLENMIKRIEKLGKTKPEPLQTPPRLSPAKTPQRTRSSSAPEGQGDKEKPKPRLHSEEREDPPKKRSPKPSANSVFDLTDEGRIRRLQKCNIDYFYGSRDKYPYREDFETFLKLFERFTDGVPDTIKLDELIKRLRGEAFTFVTKAEQDSLTYDGLVESLKLVFFKMETSKEKRLMYENLRQRDNEHVEEFQVRFLHAFKEYYTLISGPNSNVLKDEILKCNEFYQKIRPVLHDRLEKRAKVIMDDKTNLKWSEMIEEIRKIEREYPAKDRDNAKNVHNQRGKGRGTSTQNYRGNANKYQNSYGRGNYNQPKFGKSYQQNSGSSNYNKVEQKPYKVVCFTCGEEGHTKRDCKLQQKSDPYQPKGNAIDPKMSQRGRGGFNNRGNRGNNHTRGNFNNRGNRRSRGPSRGNFRGSNRGHMNMAYDENYQNDNYEDQDDQPESSLSYAEKLANMYCQFDPQSEPLMHTLPHRMMKCIDPGTQIEKEIATFSLAAAKYRPRENPEWKAKHMNENTVNKIRNTAGWAIEMAKKHKSLNHTAVERQILNSITASKWTCIDEARLTLPLIIEGVCIEDILPDTGSMFNAISLKALWALAGRFERWEKAFDKAISWCCNKEKTIQAAGGQEIPVLAVIRLHVQVAGRKELPLHWAVYEDTEPIIVLGTRGMKALGIELKSPHLGDINLLVAKDKIVETSNKVFHAAFHVPMQKTPEDVTMKSPESPESPMDVDNLSEIDEARRFLKLAKVEPKHTLYEQDMARLGLTQLSQDTIGKIEFNPNMGKMLTTTESENQETQPSTSYGMQNGDQVFRERWDQWRSPNYDA